MEQILDTSQYVKDRAECAQELRNELENCDEKTFYEIHLNSQKILTPAIEKYAADHNISFKNPESVFGDPSAYLMDLAMGAGNIVDFIMMDKTHRAKTEGYFGKETMAEADMNSKNALVLAMGPKFIGKKADVFTKLAEGRAPKHMHGAIFTDALKAEVIMGIFAKLEKPGQVYSPNIDMLQVEATYNMVLAHPKMNEFFKKASNEQLMELMAKENILKELNIDFEILSEKKVPGIDLKSEELDLDEEMGTPTLETSVVPTFDGSSAYYEMDTLENVMIKVQEREAAKEMEDDMEMS